MRFFPQKSALFSAAVAGVVLFANYAIRRTDQKLQAAAKGGNVSSLRAEAAPAGTSIVAARGRTAATQASQLPISTVRKPAIQASTLLAQTTYFEPNEGQADPQVLFTNHGAGYTLFLARTGITVVLPVNKKPARATSLVKPDFLRLGFAGANLQPKVDGVDRLPGTSNYFGGSDPKLWYTHIPHFAKVRYSGLYPGIDIIFYFRDGHLEYDLDAAPGADLSAVHLRAERAKLSPAANGDIKLKTATTEAITLAKPHAYQAGSSPKPVGVTYSLRDDDLSFALDGYDRRQSLVIDPALIFATYLNSNCAPVTNGVCEDSINDIAADATGVYVVGWTNATSFPATAGRPAPTLGNVLKTFVLKLDPTGSQIIYVSYLSMSTGTSIAVDATGAAYVSGIADASPATGSAPNFPLTSGVFSGTIPPTGEFDYSSVPFATKLSPDGSQIEYSTLLQQVTPNEVLVPNAQSVAITKIAADSSGSLYLTGTALPLGASYESFWMPLPVTQGAFQTTPGGLFVLKLDPTASGFDYGTYIDGTSGCLGNPGCGFASSGIALDGAGDSYISGTAFAGFPTTANAYQASTTAGDPNAFVVELNPTGTGEVYSTFFGGPASGALDIAVDSQGEAIIVGGAGAALPTTSNAFCTAPSSGSPNEGFVAKLNPTGTGLIYSTALCGSLGSPGYGYGVAVDSSGGAYVSGVTSDPQGFQTILTGAIQRYIPVQPPGSITSIALKLNAAGALQWATFVGSGSSVDGYTPLQRVAVDPSGSMYILQYSNAGAFPTTPDTVGLRVPGSTPPVGISAADFLLKIAPNLGAPVPLTIPTTVTFSAQNVGAPSAPTDVELGNFGDAQLSSVQISTTGDFSETDNCSGGVAAGQKCDINVVFTPTAAGSRTGILNLNFGGGLASQTVPLSGTGTAPIASVSPTSLSFGDQATGTTSAAQQVTVTNTGTGSLTVSSIQTTSQFAETNTCGGAIAPNGNCTIQVTFTPSASGPQTGTLTITDNASGNPQTVSLSGNQPAGFTIAPGGGASSTSATVSAGQTASYSLSLTGTNGFTGSVSFTCSGAPSYSTCTVSPNPANLSGTSAMPVNISVSTQAGSNIVPLEILTPKNPTQRELLTATAMALAMLVSFLFIGRDGASRKRLFAGAALLLATVVVAAGCGGSSYTPPKQNKTPPGQYTLAVTATSGSVTQSTNLTLTVN